MNAAALLWRVDTAFGQAVHLGDFASSMMLVTALLAIGYFVSRPRCRESHGLERVTRIELALSAWEADVLPLNYTRGTLIG